MGRRSFSKKYRVVDSFTYRGPDGNWPYKQAVIVGPGEEMPKLNSSELEKLLTGGKICELDLHGEMIPNKRLIDMNGEEVNRLLEGKSEPSVVQIIRVTNFNQDTLARILVFCEKAHYKQASLIVDEKLATV